MVTMGDKILGHKDLFSFHKKDIVADSSLAPHAKSFTDMVLNKKTMVMPLPSISSIPQQKDAYVSVKVNPTAVEEQLNLFSKNVQKSPDVLVKKIFTSLASDLDKDNTLVHFGYMEDEVEIIDSLEKNKAHYDKDDELATIDENVNTKEDVALNHDLEHILNMDKVVNTELHEEHIEAPTVEVGISDSKDSSSFTESKSDHSLDTSDLSQPRSSHQKIRVSKK
ncbi:hypothetical protein PanWU01x14_037910 [Parasponia andersonii]|uniref:Uncharacterized protein n=1 Tax=Parasponia andersonii TaxID=3476 RepID=A0A2P5DS08_PARAD|nr:hypothetical protein PanWU01x14_037910 [Parasponia andersonii]